MRTSRSPESWMLVVVARIRDFEAARAEAVSPQDSMVRVEMSAIIRSNNGNLFMVCSFPYGELLL